MGCPSGHLSFIMNTLVHLFDGYENSIVKSENDMIDISDFPFQEHAGQIVEYNKNYKGKKYVLHKTKLILDSGHDEVKENLAICYMMVVMGGIKKVGQTSGEGGLWSCMSFYGSAGQDDPSITRFGINLLMREEIKKGNAVDIYFQYDRPHWHTFNGAVGEVTQKVLMSAKHIEEDCLSHYVATTGKYPDWNFQEDGNKHSMPRWIEEEYGEYIHKRKGKK